MRIILFSIICLKFSILVGMGARQEEEPSLAVKVFTAVINYDEDALKALLAGEGKNELASIRDGKGRTPLHHAAEGYRTKLIPILIEAGAPVNDNSNVWQATPLIFAVENRFWIRFGDQNETVRALLKADVDPAIKDAQGRNAVEIARQYGQKIDFMQLLETKMKK